MEANGAKPRLTSKQTAIVFTWHPTASEDESIKATTDLATNVLKWWAGIGVVHCEVIGDVAVARNVPKL